MFKKSQHNPADDFAYLPDGAVYFDSACQSLRPQPVIDAMRQYYQEFNSCGERVRYEWGLKVDQQVAAVRKTILKALKLSERDYFVSFTLNTTYGLNLLQSQLDTTKFKRIITSEIEHNSTFLSTIALSKRTGLERIVVPRNDDGTVDIDQLDLDGAIVVMNAVSNIDGRQLKNIAELTKRIHAAGGIMIIDAAQTMSHYRDLIAGVPADAICFSSHKMYGPSLGVMVVRRSLLQNMSIGFVGGGMVDDVERDSYQLSAEHKEHNYTAFEAGLQLYAEIIGLGAAFKWMDEVHKSDHTLDYAGQVIELLKSKPGVHVLNAEVTPTISFYHDTIDGHLIAEALSDAGIMARSGYFCVHYYLKHVKQYPPLVRLSLGMHNRQSDVDRFAKAIEGWAK